MTSLTATDARKSFFELLKNATERHEIFRIRHRGGNAVLIAEDEYEALLETLDLLSAPGFREGFSIAKQEAAAGDTVGFDEVFGEAQ